MTRMTVAGLGCLLAAALATAPANAAVTVNVVQSGANLVSTATGSFDLSGLTVLRSGSFAATGIAPSDGILVVGAIGGFDAFTLSGGPTNFGPGTGISFSSTTMGQTFGIYASNAFREIRLGTGYVSNSAINSTATISNATFASLGLNTGTYNFTSGVNTITVTIGSAASAVPEPAAWALMIVGAGAIGGVMRRQRYKSAVTFA